jgi:hypothetical protein
MDKFQLLTILAQQCQPGIDEKNLLIFFIHIEIFKKIF